MVEVGAANVGLSNLFETAAKKYSSSPALVTGLGVSGDGVAEGPPASLSFGETLERVRRVARYLSRRLGVRSGDKVLIVCHGHVVSEVVGSLACMRLGAPFVPIDARWLRADSRGQEICSDLAASDAGAGVGPGAVAAVLVGEDDRDEIVCRLRALGVHRCVLLRPDGGLHPALLALLAEDQETGGTEDAAPLPAERMALSAPVSEGASIVCVLYTSGSTGAPKGVLCSQVSLLARLRWQRERFPWAAGNMGCRRTPLTFVDAAVELLSPLLAGVPLLVPPPAVVERGIGAVARAAAAAGVSRITLLPSQLDMILRQDPDIGRSWPALGCIFVSGEPTRPCLVERFKRCFPAGRTMLVNLFGSTEVAGDVLCAVLYNPSKRRLNSHPGGAYSSFAEVPVGCVMGENGFLLARPTDQGQGQVLDGSSDCCDARRLRLVGVPSDSAESSLALVEAADEPGELYVHGPYLSPGYHNADRREGPSLDARFMQAELPDGRRLRLFRSGDLVRRASALKKLPWQRCYLSCTSRACDPSWEKTPAGFGGEVCSECRHFGPAGTPSDSDSSSRGDDGSVLVWVGRVDNQVKIRGVRLELEEVERAVGRLLPPAASALAAGPHCAIALAVPSGVGGEDGPRLLVVCLDAAVASHIATSDGAACAPTSAQLVEFFRRGGMLELFLPQLVLCVKAVPLTASGKADRVQLLKNVRALVTAGGTARADRDVGVSASAVDCPDGSAQSVVGRVAAVLRRIFAAVVPAMGGGGADNGRVVSFQALGGDSMSAVEVLWRLGRPGEWTDVLPALVAEARDATAVAADCEAAWASALSALTVAELLTLSPTDLASLLLDKWRAACHGSAEAPIGAVRGPVGDGGSDGDGQLGGVHKRRRLDSSVPQAASPAPSMASGDALWVAGGAERRLKRLVCRQLGQSVGPLPGAVVVAETESAAGAQLQVSWKRPLARCVDAAPLYAEYETDGDPSVAVVGTAQVQVQVQRRVYIGSHGGDVLALALHPDAGGDAEPRLCWSAELGEHIEAALASGCAGELLFVSAYVGQDADGPAATDAAAATARAQLLREFPRLVRGSLGSLWCLQAATGVVIWRAELAGEAKGSAVCDEVAGVVLVGSHDHHLHGFRALTGEPLLKVAIPGSVFASPVLMPPSSPQLPASAVFVGSTSGHLQCIELAAETLAPGSAARRAAVAWAADVVEGPAAEWVLARMEALAELWDVATGATRWSARVPALFATPALITPAGAAAAAGPVLVVGTMGRTLLAMRALTGVALWEYQCGSSIFSSCCTASLRGEGAVAGGGSEPAEVVVFGCHDGCVRCVEVDSGALRWERRLSVSVYGAPALAALGGSGAAVVAVATTGGGLELLDLRSGVALAALRLPGEVFSSPILVESSSSSARGAASPGSLGGMSCELFVGCRDDNLYCVNVLSGSLAEKLVLHVPAVKKPEL